MRTGIILVKRKRVLCNIQYTPKIFAFLSFKPLGVNIGPQMGKVPPALLPREQLGECGASKIPLFLEQVPQPYYRLSK